MRLGSIPCMLLAVLSVAAAAQDSAPVQDTRFEDERASPFEDTLDQADRERGFSTFNDAEARQAIDTFGKCVVERKPTEADRLLSRDFTTSGYRTGLRLLSQEATRSCVRDSIGGASAMRSSDLLFAGAMAEALLERDATPLNVRLVRSAGRDVRSYSPSDIVAQCLARSLPDQVAALFATTPGGDAERTAVAPLLQAAPACARAAGIDARVELTAPGIRAIVATAAYRLVSNPGDTHAQG